MYNMTTAALINRTSNLKFEPKYSGIPGTESLQ